MPRGLLGVDQETTRFFDLGPPLTFKDLGFSGFAMPPGVGDVGEAGGVGEVGGTGGLSGS